MALHIPYHRKTFRPVNDVVAGNDHSDNPVEFDLAPAEGSELARIKSVIVAAAGLVDPGDWTKTMQDGVISAFETAAPAFVNTVEAIRGLTVPAALAKRVGIIGDIPKTVPQGQTEARPDANAPIPILTGYQFSRICGFVPAMSLHVALEIAALSQQTEVDPRLFVQPSGSGGPGTLQRTPSTAGNARSGPRRRGTAARRKR